jgi:hypothetical protein
MDSIRRYNISDLASEFNIRESDVRKALVEYIGKNMYYSADHESIMIISRFKNCENLEEPIADGTETDEHIIFVSITNNQLVVKLDIYWDLEFSFTEKRLDHLNKEYICDIQVIPTNNSLRRELWKFFFEEIHTSDCSPRKYTKVFVNADPDEVDELVCNLLPDINDSSWAKIILLKYEDRTDVEVAVHTDYYDGLKEEEYPEKGVRK